jgi:hypothetical protein
MRGEIRLERSPGLIGPRLRIQGAHPWTRVQPRTSVGRRLALIVTHHPGRVPSTFRTHSTGQASTLVDRSQTIWTVPSGSPTRAITPRSEGSGQRSTGPGGPTNSTSSHSPIALLSAEGPHPLERQRVPSSTDPGCPQGSGRGRGVIVPAPRPGLDRCRTSRRRIGRHGKRLKTPTIEIFTMRPTRTIAPCFPSTGPRFNSNLDQ